MDPVPPPNPSIILDSYDQAWQCMISGAAPRDELASLMKTIFSSEKATDMADRLQGSDVQTCIDVIDLVWHRALPSPEYGLTDLCFNFLHSVDQALDNLELVPRIRRRSMRLLRTMCARHTLVTTSLRIELCEDSPGILMYGGGFGDVWKREHRGQAVAVKVLRTFAASDLQKTTRVGCQWRFLFPVQPLER